MQLNAATTIIDEEQLIDTLLARISYHDPKSIIHKSAEHLLQQYEQATGKVIERRPRREQTGGKNQPVYATQRMDERKANEDEPGRPARPAIPEARQGCLFGTET